MGYDNECIVNIQSLPGEYFCPVCRTLVNPSEALQAQCTHLYCKPCLAYLVATTPACPYDGYLVTEADAKPLTESSKELAESIGKVAVYCLYHRSNCQWQGTLAESNAHCAGCSFGNSPVVCNRCGTQIVHRQVQEHAQICPGVQPQAQAAENSQAQATQDPSSAASAAAVAATTSAPATAAATPAAPATASASAPASSGPTSTPAAVTPAAAPQAAAQAPTPEQWYQQQQLQYQQYYQQYPGYDAYNQQYQQYSQYQQQVYPQYGQPQMQAMVPGQQPQPYVQQPQPQPGQPQVQTQPQPHAQPLQQPQPQQQPHLPQPQPQPHPYPQPQAQPQPHIPAQVPQMQPFAPHQPHPNAPPQSLPLPPQPHATQARPPQMQAPPQQMPPPQAYPQHQPRPQHPPQTHPIQQQPPMQMQPQPQSHPHPQMQPPQPPAHPVSGYQSYPQPTLGAPQQQPPMHMHPQHPPQSQGQFPPQPPQMRPPHSQMLMPPQQQPGMPPAQGPPANLHPMQQHPIQQPGQQVYPQPNFPQAQPQPPFHPGQQPQQVPPQHQVHPQQSLRPHGPAYMQQPAPGHPHPQGLPPQQVQARPMMAGPGMPQQPVPQSPGAGSNLMQPSINQQPPNQNYSGRANQSGPIQQSQAPHGGKQGGASPATPKQGDGLVVKNAEGTKSGEKSTDHVSDTMSKSNEEKAAADAKDKDSQAEDENKDVPEKIVKDEIVDGQLVKKEEGTNLLGGLTEGSDSRKGQEGKFDDKSSAQFKGGGVSEGQNAGNISSMPSQQMQATHALDRGQLQQQSAHQSVFPAQGRGYPPAGQGMPPGPPKQFPYGQQPHMSDPGMISHRPPVPDGMFQQPIHQSSQERRFPEPSHQVPVHGQAMLPSQMRPPVHNVHETFPQQRQMPVAQEAFWPPPHAGPPGPRLPPPPPPPPGGAPNHHGIPPKGFDQQAMARPVMGGPPPGALDAPNRMMAGPSFTPEDKMGRSASFNTMEAEAHANRRPGVYDGRQPDTHRPLPNEHAPYGHPSAMKMNGMTNNAAVGGMHDSEDRFRPLPDERFKPFPEGGFKAAHDEHFRPSSLDPGRHVNRREFEEDLKQFPRPAHLDGEGPHRFDGYPTSRPLDRMAQQSGGANAFRPPSSYQSGAPFPPRFGNSESPLDIAREHLGRRHDGTFPHPDRLNLVPEFDRPRLRSPGR